MKKLFIMFAACIAAVSLVSCNSCNKSDEEITPESVTEQLTNAADEEAAVGLLDGWKAKADEMLKGGNQEGYFKIINSIKTAWEKNGPALLEKFPGLKDKIESYITVPDNLKEAFNQFMSNAGEKVEEAADAAKDKAEEVADAAKDKAEEVAEAASDAASDVADKVENAVE